MLLEYMGKLKRSEVSCLITKANVFVSVFLLLSIGIYKTEMSRKKYIYVCTYIYIYILPFEKEHLFHNDIIVLRDWPPS